MRRLFFGLALLLAPVTVFAQGAAPLVQSRELAVGAAAANLGFTPLNPANNLSDLANVVTARGYLGLGTAATQAVGTSGATLCLLTSSCTWTGVHTFANYIVQPYVAGGALTTSGYSAALGYNANYSGLSVIHAIYSGYSGYDGLAVVADNPIGSTLTQVNGVGSYVKVHAATNDGVLFFGSCLSGDLAATNGGKCWGANTAISDDSTPGTYTGSTTARELITFEGDVYNYHSDTLILGFTATPANGATLKPATGYAFVAQPWSSGNGFWTSSFVSQTGAAVNALIAGATSTASSSYSQSVIFNYITSGGVSTNINVQATPAGELDIGGALGISSSYLIHSSTSLYNGAGSSVATLTNGPSSGNPTKWIQINDNGTTRYIPAW